MTGDRTAPSADLLAPLSRRPPDRRSAAGTRAHRHAEGEGRDESAGRTLSGPLADPNKGSALQDPRDALRAAVRQPDRLNVIAECKRRSPSRGVLRADYDAVSVARGYAGAGGGRHFSPDGADVFSTERFEAPSGGSKRGRRGRCCGKTSSSRISAALGESGGRMRVLLIVTALAPEGVEPAG